MLKMILTSSGDMHCARGAMRLLVESEEEEESEDSEVETVREEGPAAEAKADGLGLELAMELGLKWVEDVDTFWSGTGRPKK